MSKSHEKTKLPGVAQGELKMRDLDPWGQMEIPFWEGVMLIFIVAGLIVAFFLAAS